METVDGQPVAVIGSFPLIPEDPRLIANGYAEWAVDGPPTLMRWPRVALMGAMLASGNSDVPEPLGGYQGFQAVVASQEFRVAVCIRNASATWNDATGTVNVQCFPECHEGYTPVNLWTYTRNAPVPWQRQTTGYKKGVSKFKQRLIHTSSASVTLIVIARVKLCNKYNLGQKVVTGYLAPWAVVKIKYTIRRDGVTQVEFRGSKIPGQRNYVEWNLCGSHDMQTNSYDEVRLFVERGHCLDADTNVVSAFP
jgi:hypothetical protein